MVSPNHAALISANADMGHDVYDMLQTFTSDENGFSVEMSGLPYDAFPGWIAKMEKYSRGEELSPGHVPQTLYILYADGRPCGILKLRHYLNDALREHGGHIGYAVCPAARGQGYGTLQLALGLEKARALGLDRVLITANSDNAASRRVAMKNGARVEKDDGEHVWMWIDL